MPAKKKLVLKKKKSPKKSKNIMKKMEDLTPVQIDEISQNKVNTLYYSLFVYVIVILWIVGIIKYLRELEKCDCFLEKNIENNANLKYLIYVEYVILVINVISVLSCVYLLATSNQNGGMDIQRMKMYLILYLAIYIGIFGYFVYSFYKLQQNIDASCECASSSMRFLLYIQAFLMAIGVFGAFLNLMRLSSF
jgi:heme/copper-type cytochrome/quinol oxidase subunit 2